MSEGFLSRAAYREIHLKYLHKSRMEGKSNHNSVLPSNVDKCILFVLLLDTKVARVRLLKDRLNMNDCNVNALRIITSQLHCSEE